MKFPTLQVAISSCSANENARASRLRSFETFEHVMTFLRAPRRALGSGRAPVGVAQRRCRGRSPPRYMLLIGPISLTPNLLAIDTAQTFCVGSSSMSYGPASWFEGQLPPSGPRVPHRSPAPDAPSFLPRALCFLLSPPELKMRTTLAIGFLASLARAAPQAALFATTVTATVSVPAPTGIPSTSTPGPIVALDYATFQGSNASGIVNFLGMPFAQPVRLDVHLGGRLAADLESFAAAWRPPFCSPRPASQPGEGNHPGHQA